MQRVVPDASVILKWALPAERESHVEQAMAVLDAHLAERVELLVPPLWLFEVGNTVARQFPDLAGEVLADLRALGMSEPPWERRLIAEAVRLTAEYRVTFYDAAYHALAHCEEATLVSADNGYLRALAAEPRAMALADWG